MGGRSSSSASNQTTTISTDDREAVGESGFIIGNDSTSTTTLNFTDISADVVEESIRLAENSNADFLAATGSAFENYLTQANENTKQVFETSEDIFTGLSNDLTSNTNQFLTSTESVFADSLQTTNDLVGDVVGKFFEATGGLFDKTLETSNKILSSNQDFTADLVKEENSPGSSTVQTVALAGLAIAGAVIIFGGDKK